MKKLFFIVSLTLTAFLLAACGNGQKIASIDSLAGEWSIIKIDGEDVTLSDGQEEPFIGFDTNEKRVYGSAGCNLLTGSLDADAKSETIDFSSLGSTRMMCPDMQLEEQVLNGLAKVKKFKMLKSGEIELKGADGKTVMLLRNRTK